MIDTEAFDHDIDTVREKLRSRLGARGRTLAKALRSAGRSLPKPARQAGQRLVQLQRMVAHPRLRRLVNRNEVDAALAELTAPLDGIDPAERRKDRLLGFAASAVFNVLLLSALMVAFMRWRGLI